MGAEPRGRVEEQRSSTTKQSVPSGSRTTPRVARSEPSRPMLDASRANSKPSGATTRHNSSTVRANCASSATKCRTALQMTASMLPLPTADARPQRHGSDRPAASEQVNRPAGASRPSHQGRDWRRTIEAVQQEEDEVSAVSTAGIEHPPALIEIAFQQLIEEIDVDLAERFTEIVARRSGRIGHWRML